MMAVMRISSTGEYILGIDLGANSLGWAILPKEAATDGNISCGSRIFEAGVDGGADRIAAGTDEPRTADRRNARLQRRQTLRRARKRAKLFRQLQEARLLPEGDASTAEKRHQILHRLDNKIKQEIKTPATEDILPYILRAKALDGPLHSHHLGRAFYHLAQRRGFLSNRVSTATKDEEKDEGAVKKGIGELWEKMKAAKARTLGEYFAGLDPHETRVRKRWTHRDMFTAEFDEIWKAQAPYHPKILTPDLKKELHRTLFDQRPLKVKRQFLGECELEKGRKRAPWSLLDAQRFRYLQKINNLRVPCEDGVEKDINAFPEALGQLIKDLDRKEEVTYCHIKKLLGIPKEVQLNLERGGETKIKGNVTAARIRKAIGHWDRLSEQQQESLVEDMRSIQKRDTLARRATRHWGFDEETARKLAAVPLEGGYCNLSRQALAKLIPLLEKGVSYSTACKELYPDRYKADKPLDRLPPVRKQLPSLRNPAVERSLTELRKVVNALLAKYGKPVAIHIELARDLRRPRKERQNISKRMRRNENLRLDIRRKIEQKTGDPDPARGDILKVRLAEECNWICPYTGTSISMDALIGEAPQFDIEHIIPFDRCFENSFANKTLCLADVNRHRKRGMTPWEAFHQNADEWEQIIGRVRRFQGPAGREKLRRFQLRGEVLEEQLSNFSSRHLNDTRYASRLAAEYLGLLYGGFSDDEQKRRILVSSGQVTSHVRSAYDLNSILNDGPTRNGGEKLKQRHDHRHHAVDAIALALTDQTMVQKLSDAARQAESQRRRRRLFAAVPEPWTGFMRSVRGAVAEMTVSHRVRRKVHGAIHEETLYSKPKQGLDKKGQPVTVRHVRKPVSSLTRSQIHKIVDTRVREVVEARVVAHDGDLRKALADENNPLRLPTRNDESVPIRSVRIQETINTKEIGAAERLRHVKLGSNHHLEVVAVLDEDGKEKKWEGAIVTLYDAYQRKQRREHIVKRNHGEGKRFKFSLCGGDTIYLSEEDGLMGLFQVRVISQEAPKDGRKPTVKVEFAGINDARKKQGEDSIKEANEWYTRSPDPLRQMSCEKVTVSPIGEVIPCHD